MIRITEHLKTTGPDLHDHQYGFRQGRSTIDAINRVVNIAEGAIRLNGVALAVSVDIVNVFNPLQSYVECDSTSLFVLTRPMSSVTRHHFVFCHVLCRVWLPHSVSSFARLCLNLNLNEIR